MIDMYSEIFRNMSEAFAIHKIICDENEKPIDYKFLDVNPAFERITGLKKEDVVGRRVLDILPKTEPYWIDIYGRVAMEEKTIKFEQYSVEFDKYFQVEAFSGKKGEFATLFIDITKRKKSELLFQKYKFFFENARDIFLFIGMDGKILDANNAALKAYGYSREELLNMNIFDLRYNDDVNYISGQMNKANTKGLLFEAYHRRKDGMMIPVQVNSVGVKIGEKDVLMSIIRDITDQKKYKEKMNHMAYYDSLTDLPNRKFFTEKLNDALIETEKTKRKLSVMFFDIDKFKSINDTYGHDIGDLLLVDIANRIKDIINKNDIAARFGGDEFVLFQSCINKVEEASELAEELLSVIKKPFKIKEHDINITTSMGISIYPDHGKSIEQLIKKADIAMYIVKNKSRNSYRFYE